MVPDVYAAAKASLRENVKTLITVFAGISGALIAGTSFSGYGLLPLWSTRWWVASAGFSAALLMIIIAICILVGVVLRPDINFTSELIRTPEKSELKDVQAEFESVKNDLLPRNIATLQDLVNEKQKAWDDYQASPGDLSLRAAHDGIADTLTKINNWAAFARLHRRVKHGMRFAIPLGLVALGGIIVFVLAVASKTEAKTPTYIVVSPALPPVIDKPNPEADIPPLDSVEFTPRLSRLEKEEVKKIVAATDYLRAHPAAAILLLAHADTTGGDRVNEALAARRVESVSNFLQKQGGINRDRIFVRPLGKQDLPEPTLDQTDDARNRVVDMVLLLVPARS